MFAACHDPVIQMFLPVLGFMPEDGLKTKATHAERF
jgi:hypothetical protein